MFRTAVPQEIRRALNECRVIWSGLWDGDLPEEEVEVPDAVGAILDFSEIDALMPPPIVSLVPPPAD